MDRQTKYDILKIGKEAAALKTIDNSVINGTVGSFFYDDAKFHGYKTIRKIINSLNDDEMYAYSTISGGEEYKKAVLKWVFKGQHQKILANTNYDVVATPGGTGALHLALKENLQINDSVLIHDLCWEPYLTMCEINGYKPQIYPLFSPDSRFNIEMFIYQCEEMRKAQGKIVTILNDLCNNPTGYTLSNQEFAKVCNYFNSISEPVTFIYDIAYFDYTDINQTLEKFANIAQMNENVTSFLCFSGSKSFCMYGLRIGGLIIINKNKEKVDHYFNLSNVISRTTWSNVSRVGISTLIKLTSDEELFNEFKLELDQCVNLLTSRHHKFEEEARAVGLKINPTTNGFFISIPVNDPGMAFEKLKAAKIYVIPLKSSLRVGICSIPFSEISGLALKIKNVLEV